MSTHDELVALLRANPEDEGTWRVLQDWLLGEGDPRGKLAAATGAEAEALLQALAPDWCGREVAVSGDEVVMHEDLEDRYSPGITLRFHRGHIQRIAVQTTWDGDRESWGEEWILPTLQRIVSHPVGMLFTELELRATPYDEFTYDGLTDAVTSEGPLAVRRVYAGDNDQLSWTNVPDVESLWAAAPHLDEVTLEGSQIHLGWENGHPTLRKLRLVSGGLPTEPPAALARGDLPKLEHLEVWFGSSDYGAMCAIGDVRPLLARPFPALRHMGLQNCEFGDAIAAELRGAVWLPRIESLCMAGSVLTDAGGAQLLDAAPALKHLASLDLTQCYLTPGMVERLRSAFGAALRADGQKTPSNWGSGDRYYVAVGE